MTDLTTPAAETTTAASVFTPAPAPTTAAEALSLLRACGVSEPAALELLVAVAVATEGEFEVGCAAEFDDAPCISAFEAAGRLWVNLGLSDAAYAAGLRAEAREVIAATVARNDEPDGRGEEVDSDFREAYVACVYGAQGDEPGDCWVQVNRRPDGAYVLSEGDDAVQNGADGAAYLTLDGARAAAEDLALDLDEGDGEDAEGVVAAERAAARERANDSGEWAFGFVDPDGSTRADLRFDSRDDAQALVDEWEEGVQSHNPGTNILWGSMTRAAVLFLDDDGEWAEAGVEDDEDRYGLGRRA